jgi:hypothetical protein
MKLTANYVEHLHGAIFAYIGTRNSTLIPNTQMVQGVLVSPDREDVTVFLLESQSEVVLQNLMDNGRFALTAANPLTFETYQFKGSFMTSYHSDAKDVAIQRICVDKLNAAIKPLWSAPSERKHLMTRNPLISIVLRVEEIFEQTPEK